MKRLFIAVLCSVIGMSAYASDLTPTVKPTVATLELKTASNEGKFEVSTKEQSIDKSRRRQMMFTFYDHCGNGMNVWVSGASGASDYTLWCAAFDHAVYASVNGGGCF